MSAHWTDEACRVARGVRRRALELCLGRGGGYLSQACSSAEILATLYTRVLRLGPSEAPLLPRPFAGVPSSRNPGARTGAAYNGPKAPGLDRFVFSPVHYAVALYATLVEVRRMAPEGLAELGRDGSAVELIGAEHSPGHEVTAGSLGQALSQAGGIALARRLRGEPGRVFVLMSDGELQEGQTWEAFAALAHHGLDNLAVYLDANGQQCDGPVSAVMGLEPETARLEAFGARVREVDGHDLEALAAPAREAPDGRPLVVLCRTDPCRGLPRLRGRAPRLHYVRFHDAAEREAYRQDLARLRAEESEPVIELVSRPHAAALVRFAANRPEALVLSADLTSSCEAEGFREAFPARFLSMGMAEQNMIGFAAGLAREGFRPLVHSFGVFLCRRAFDQVAMAVAYPNLPVRLLGFLPGVTTPGGVTHQAIDDLALMRALPNMTVLECGDATEVEGVLEVADRVDGPVYVRMLRGEVPRLFPASEPLRLGEARLLRADGELLVVSSGVCSEEASRALAAMAERGLAAAHLHVSTLKPFPPPELAAALGRATAGVVTVENHSVVGGLGSAVAEVMAGSGLGIPLRRLGLQDTFAHGGSRAALIRELGLDALAVVRAVEALAGRDLGLSPGDLAPSATPSERTLA